MQAIRKFALSLPEAEEGVACQGTALECATVQVAKKAFVFLGTKEIRLKLGASLAEAEGLAKQHPEQYQLGGTGWVKVSHGREMPLDLAVLKPWVQESYQLFMPNAGGKKPAKPKARASKRK